MFGGCLGPLNLILSLELSSVNDNLDASVITTIVCLIWMPETLGKSLQEVDEVWENSVQRSKAILGRHRRQSSVDEDEIIEMELEKTPTPIPIPTHSL